MKLDECFSKIGSPVQNLFEFNKFLLRLRNQPSEATGKSPAELLMQRCLRDRFSQLLERVESKPGQPQPNSIRFSVGERVAARLYNNSLKWIPGSIDKVCGPRNFLVRTSRGILRRHVDQLRRSQVQEKDGYGLLTHFGLEEKEDSQESSKDNTDDFDTPGIGLEFSFDSSNNQNRERTSTPRSKIPTPSTRTKQLRGNPVDYRKLHLYGNN